MKLTLALVGAFVVASAIVVWVLVFHESSDSLLPARPEALANTSREAAPVALEEARSEPEKTRSVLSEVQEELLQEGPLSDNVVLFGRCLDPDEAPVLGVNLRLLARDLQLVDRTALTDAEGRFEISWPCPPDGRLFLEVGGYGYGRQIIEDPRFACRA